ncbi:hypothetical protein BLOT_007923, partial [Blomia tropicalis]
QKYKRQIGSRSADQPNLAPILERSMLVNIGSTNFFNNANIEFKVLIASLAAYRSIYGENNPTQ